MGLDLAGLAEAGADGETLRLMEEALRQSRERQLQRQREGIAAAKARGVRFGRPAVEAPPNFPAIVEEWEGKRLSIDAALRLCGMSSSTFFRRVRDLRRSQQKAF